MKNTFFETEILAKFDATNCFSADLLHAHAQHSEALAEQLLCLESLDARASSIVHNPDTKYRGIQAILLAPAIYASAEMPPHEKD